MTQHMAETDQERQTTSQFVFASTVIVLLTRFRFCFEKITTRVNYQSSNLGRVTASSPSFTTNSMSHTSVLLLVLAPFLLFLLFMALPPRLKVAHRNGIFVDLAYN